MIGTFYCTPSPDKPPFVNVGDDIQSGKVLCIIEAMKLFNEIESEVTGKVVKVLVEKKLTDSADYWLAHAQKGASCDGKLVETQTEDVVELSNGCVCCTVRKDLCSSWGVRGSVGATRSWAGEAAAGINTARSEVSANGGRWKRIVASSVEKLR